MFAKSILQGLLNWVSVILFFYYYYYYLTVPTYEVRLFAFTSEIRDEIKVVWDYK